MDGSWQRPRCMPGGVQCTQSSAPGMSEPPGYLPTAVYFTIFSVPVSLFCMWNSVDLIYETMLCCTEAAGGLYSHASSSSEGKSEKAEPSAEEIVKIERRDGIAIVRMHSKSHPRTLMIWDAALYTLPSSGLSLTS
jgi:hypothetical protein